MPDMKLFAGNATPELAQRTTSCLYTSLSDAAVGRFNDGRVSIRTNENMRGGGIFIIQSAYASTGDNLVELVTMADAPCRASAGRITAIIPYFGYTCQSRHVRFARVPVTTKAVVDFLSSVGIDRVLTVDLHAEQIQSSLDVPVDNVFGSPILLKGMLRPNLGSPIVVSPDIGGVVHARAIVKLLSDTNMIIIGGRRLCTDISQMIHIIGDVADRDCVLVDDMIDTGGTLYKTAEVLKEHSAEHVFAYTTHPIFSGNTTNSLCSSVTDRVAVCDTVPLSDEIKSLPNVRILTLLGILVEAIRRVSDEESISAVFEH